MITPKEMAEEMERLVLAPGRVTFIEVAESVIRLIQSRAAGVQGADELLRSENPDRKDFTVDEALRIADQNDAAYKHAPSVSRTLAAEVRRLATPQPPKDAGAVPVCTCPSGDGSLRHPCPQHQPAEPAARAQPIDEDHPENWPAWLQDLVASTAQTATDAARAQVVGYRWRNSDHQPWTLGETVSGFDLNSREIGAAIEPLGVVTSAHPSPAHAGAGDAEWTDDQCREFARIAFRHARHNLPKNVGMQDIRMGAEFARRLAGGDHA